LQPDTDVHALINDDFGRLWAGTQMGIAVIDDGKVVRTFTPADGLPGNDVRSLVRVSFKHAFTFSERLDPGPPLGRRRQELKNSLPSIKRIEKEKRIFIEACLFLLCVFGQFEIFTVVSFSFRGSTPEASSGRAATVKGPAHTTAEFG
jgi:hypothetical protein